MFSIQQQLCFAIVETINQAECYCFNKLSIFVNPLIFKADISSRDSLVQSIHNMDGFLRAIQWSDQHNLTIHYLMANAIVPKIEPKKSLKPLDGWHMTHKCPIHPTTLRSYFGLLVGSKVFSLTKTTFNYYFPQISLNTIK